MSVQTNWFSTLIGFIEDEAADVESKIVTVAESIGPVAVQYGEEFLASLAQVAVGAVLDQAPLVLSGAEKFGAAVTSVIQQVEAKGQTIAVQDAQATVQAAFNEVRAVATRA